jgi:uncharacterized protein (TIGR02466 family)|tara:strand:- start:11 stop:634 length:624 start_codon:yes stop_codon:yes gene_type:complete
MVKHEINLKIYKPFGPSIGYCKLPKELIDDYNQDCEDILKKKLTVERDYSDQLVGNVKQELLITPKVFAKWAYLFQNIVQTYINEFTKSKDLKELQFKAGWYVRTFNGDFNPYHYHSDCKLSCVGYLSLPKGIDKEWEQEDKDHNPSAGYIEMSYGETHLFSENSFSAKPTIGDYYIFPWYLYHMVYPFRTKGERRSFSFNIDSKSN